MISRIASTPTLHAAFQRVRDNRGCAGADGVTIAEFERDLDVNLFALGEALGRGTYVPFPLLRVLVDRGDGSARQLCIPGVRDRVAQAAALAVLEPLFEAEFETCSFGYRRGRSVRDAVRAIREHYEHGYRWVVEADVDAYFDSIDHELLLERVRELVAGEMVAGGSGLVAGGSGMVDGGESRAPNHQSRTTTHQSPVTSTSTSTSHEHEHVVQLISQWVRAEVWDGSQLYRLDRGIPQGAVVAPALANLFLDDLDEALTKAGQKLVRYADDFVILCRDRGEAERAVELTNQVLARLALHLDDVAVTSFDHGFTFLGVTFMRSLVLQPFDRPAKPRRVLFMPPYLDPERIRDS